jgi:SecD/SecF fusion protein
MNSRIAVALLGAVACVVLLQQPGPARGQTVSAIGQGEVTSRTDNSVTIDWAPPALEQAELEVTVFYGDEDKGAKEDGWEHQADFKDRAEGGFQVVVEGLEPETTYVYRIRATGPDVAIWSQTGTFTTEAWNLPWYGFLAVVVAVMALPFVVGGRLAKRFRMPDHGWKIGLILCSLVAGLVVVGFRWPPKLGIDLLGGTILVYEVDQQKKDPNKPVDMDKMVSAVSERVNPGGQKEMTIRKYGAEQIEVIIPKIDPEEVKRIEKMIRSVGTLEFRILANDRDHGSLIDRARSQDQRAEGQDLQKPSMLKDAEDNVEAWWVPLRAGDKATDRKRVEGILSYPEIAKRTDRRGNWEVLVVKDLFDIDGQYLTEASGTRDQMGKPRVSFEFDRKGARLFGRLTSLNLPDKVQEFYRKLGIILDGQLYSAPRIQSTIRGEGVIEGSFTDEEVDALVRVLNAGSLPTALNEQPIFRLVTGPTLGHDTIVKGCWAIGASMVLVLAFMPFYYRFAGIVACAALVTNLVLILAVMMTVRAAFTLPGLAGLVLTVGIAVDANVLIFERIREELGRGAALRMAIRNGFSRATTTIVDANVTTLITGIILFVIGTDVVKGFAITLILGVLLSMFTAIFCSRVVFDIAERRRWITKLTMMQILGATQIDFLGKRRLAAAASLAVIVAGLAGVAWRSTGGGVGLLDIDFTGGVSVVTVFDKSQNIANVRNAFGDLPDVAVSDVQIENEPDWTWFRINTSQTEVNRNQLSQWAVQTVRQRLQEIFGDDADTPQRSSAIEALGKQIAQPLKGEPDSDQRSAAVQAILGQLDDLFAGATESPKLNSTLSTLRRQISRIVQVDSATGFVEEHIHQRTPGELSSNSMVFDNLAGIEKAAREAAATSQGGLTQPAAVDQSRGELRGNPTLAMTALAPLLLAQTDPAEPTEQPETPAGDPVEPIDKPEEAATEPAEAAQGAEDAFGGGTQARLTFTRGVSYDTVMELFVAEFGSRQAVPALELTPLVESPTPGDSPRPDRDFAPGDSTPHKLWEVKLQLPLAEAQSRLESIQAAVADTPFFPSSNTIGGKVAGATRMQAIYALAASLVFIVAYIWIRFQRVIFGLAAVVALVHDVLVTLGVIALSAFLAPYLGFLGVDQFKIGLPVLAAFLTIIGYSLNDTIVVFDRIREVRGKAPQLTQEMVNNSINQTLARTLLTSLTTLMVVLILYAFGGQEIHAFAFALVIGVIVGTYSSVFVASPVLLWMSRPSKAK